MKYHAFLIKYAEIGIKGKNRYLFEDALVKHIRLAMERVEGEFEVKKESGRIYVQALSDYDYDEAVDALKHVFGIVWICPVVQLKDEGYDKFSAIKCRSWRGYLKRIRKRACRCSQSAGFIVC